MIIKMVLNRGFDFITKEIFNTFANMKSFKKSTLKGHPHKNKNLKDSYLE